MDGRYSDITINAFGNAYKLHRLLLDQVPFFSSAFSGPWAESSSKEMTLYPEEIDNNITKNAFELALKRIYGCALPLEEQEEALSLFATGCWLDMVDLVDSSVESLLRQMHPSKLDQLINLVTSNYYGKAGDRILASAKAILFREGWEMPYHYWDNVPAEIVREIIGGDAFFIPSEWERWYLAVRLLNRRLKTKAIEAGLVAPNGRFLHPKPTSIKFFAVRFDTVYRQDSMMNSRQVAEKDEAWVSLYTSPDVAPLLVLLDEGIHYVHLRFEQLQQIRSQKDILGVPVVPEKVISSALWMCMELRQRIVNAQDSDQELHLTQVADEHAVEEDDRGLPQAFRSTPKGKEPEHDDQSIEMPSDSWDLNGRARKFWIPSTDSSSLMGGTTEAYAAAALSNAASWTPHMTRLSASLEPADAHWATDFMANGTESRHVRSYSADQQPRYSHYPPFRFSAEFPNPRTLKERKRIYSQTVWYAGSMWNLYIQRQNTPKNQQLGIYLHRAKERDPSGDSGSVPLSQLTVDDRIGHLEREMLLRKTQRRSRHWRAAVSSSGGEADPEDETSASGDGETEPTIPGGTSSTQVATSIANDSRLRRSTDLIGAHKTSDSSTATITDPRASYEHTSSTDDYLLTSSDEENDELAHISRKFNVPAMPAYVDARPTIRTYFKIYSPSKAGRMLSVYESAPDRFNFSQSWGWRSSQMVLDDGMAPNGGTGASKDGKLRYMVVIGIV